MYQLFPDNIKKKIPPLYSKKSDVKDPMVWCRFFDPTWNWEFYVISGKEDKFEEYRFFGWVKGDFDEFGEITLKWLKTAKDEVKDFRRDIPIERDIFFKPCRLSAVK